MSITITDTMIMLSLIALAPAVLFIWFFLHQARMDKNHKKLMWRTFFFGTLAIFPVLLINFLLKEFFDLDIQTILHTYTLSGSIGLIFLGCLLIAFIEEYSKSIIVKEVDWHKKEFTKIVDGIEFSVACGIGFALAENIHYFLVIYHMVLEINHDLIIAIIMRSTLSMMAHAVFSGIFGYYYGKARILNLKYRRLNKIHRSYGFHLMKGLKIRLLRLKHLFQSKNLHYELEEKLHEKELVAEGLLIAIMLHTLYNFFLTYGYAWIAVILVAVEFYIILHEFRIHKND